MNILKNKNELDKLIGEYQTDLTRLCYSLCKNHADAEDLYQETWLKAIKYYEKYNRLKPFDKWLFAICVNTFKDKMKSQSFKQAMQFETNEKKKILFHKFRINLKRANYTPNCWILLQNYQKNIRLY